MSAVEVDGEDAEFEHTGKDLVVSGDFVEDEQYELTVDYSGTRPSRSRRRRPVDDFSTTGFTVAADGSAWTMQEPYGAYSWYAVNDQPSDKAFYDFTLRVPAPWTGVANGVMTSREEEDGQTVTEWHLDSKTSSYLVTVAFGDYKVTEDESASGVPITYWVPDVAAPVPRRACEYTPEALAWVEDKLGPYPWSSLGVLLVDSHSGMETQTMITLGATDYATSQGVIVHEIVHQWYGDQVTPSDWRDLWMNEGMAMYLQFVWQAEDTGTPLDQILEQAARTERAVAAGQRSARGLRPQDVRRDPGLLRPRADVGPGPAPRRRRDVLGDGARLAVGRPRRQQQPRRLPRLGRGADRRRAVRPVRRLAAGQALAEVPAGEEARSVRTRASSRCRPSAPRPRAESALSGIACP